MLGVGEASGMFPIDSKTKDYDQNMVETFDKLIAPKGYSWKLRDILPQVLVAGEPAGNLTQEGAKLLVQAASLKLVFQCVRRKVSRNWYGSNK